MATSSGFFALPGEVRNQIHGNCLLFPLKIVVFRVKDPFSHPPYGRRPKPDRGDSSLGPSLHASILPLFLVNKRWSREARHYFYSQHVFSTPDPSVWPLSWERLPLMMRCFVDRIGTPNALSLRHLCVPFPLCQERFMKWHAYDDDTPLLPGLSKSCPNLVALEFEPRSSSQFEFALFSYPPDAQKRILIKLRDALQDEFPAIQDLILNLYDQPNPLPRSYYGQNMWPSAHITSGLRERLDNCGWIVRPAGPRHHNPTQTGGYPEIPASRAQENTTLASLQVNSQPSQWLQRKRKAIGRLRVAVGMGERRLGRDDHAYLLALPDETS